MAAEKAPQSSASGMKKETQALLCWLLAPITGLIWMNESDEFVRFHAKQSLYFGIASIVIYAVLTVTVILACLTFVWMFVDLGVRIYMAMQANKGMKTKLPVIGDMAEKA
jgi:uncharacterized membrane protein